MVMLICISELKLSLLHTFSKLGFMIVSPDICMINQLKFYHQEHAVETHRNPGIT